jgi:hypothetical protein
MYVAIAVLRDLKVRLLLIQHRFIACSLCSNCLFSHQNKHIGSWTLARCAISGFAEFMRRSLPPSLWRKTASHALSSSRPVDAILLLLCDIYLCFY